MTVDFDLEQRFDSATEALDLRFSEMKAQLGYDLSGLADLSYKHFVLGVIHGVQRVITGSNGLDAVYYEVTEEAGFLLSASAQRHPEAAEIAMEICASNNSAGKVLPESLRPLAASFIRGDAPVAKQPGKPISTGFVERFILYDAVLYVRDAFGLKIARSGGEESLSACDAVSMVARRHGLELPYTRLRDWCQSPKSAQFRRKADALSNHLKDAFLLEIGVLKRESVYGPLRGMLRLPVQNEPH